MQELVQQPRRRFRRPSLAEVMAIAATRGLADVDWARRRCAPLGGLGVGLMGNNLATAGAVWAPTTPSGLVAWFRADHYNGSTGVWTDQSGNGHNASSGTNKPVLTASDAAYNNQATATYSAGLSVFSNTAAFTTVVQPTMAFIVGEGSAGTLFDGIDSTNREVLFLNGGVWTMFAGSLLASTNNTTTKHLWILKFNGASSTMAIDVKTPPGSAGTSGVTGAAGSNSIAGIMLGAQEPPSGASSFLTGKIAEFALYSTPLGGSDITSLGGYISSRYTITVGP